MSAAASAPRTRRTQRKAPRSVATARTLSGWLPYWENELGARDVSAATVANQRKAFARLIEGVGDVPPEGVTPEQLIGWRDKMAKRCKGSTVNMYLTTVGTFYNWLASENVIGESPLLSVPFVNYREDDAPLVLSGEALRRVAKAAGNVRKGRSRFVAVRDPAILSLLQDSGLRASEVAGLLSEHVDLPARQAYVHREVAKGRKPRTVTFGFQTARVLARYARAREEHEYAFLPQFFLGQSGPASYHLVWEMVKKAGRREGVIGARPHLYRHTWAHDLKSAGVSEEVLMSLGGWSTTDMPRRYGRALKAERALETMRQVGSPVDRARAKK